MSGDEFYYNLLNMSAHIVVTKINKNKPSVIFANTHYTKIPVCLKCHVDFIHWYWLLLMEALVRLVPSLWPHIDQRRRVSRLLDSGNSEVEGAKGAYRSSPDSHTAALIFSRLWFRMSH